VRWLGLAALSSFFVVTPAVNAQAPVITNPHDLNVLATNEAFDLVGNTWTTKTSMPTARDSFSISEVSGKIYVAGGEIFNNCTPVNILEEYNPTSNTWVAKRLMPTPRSAAGAASVNGIMYVIGGSAGCGGVFQVVEAYDPVMNTWDTTRMPMPTGRYGFGVGVVNGIIYAIGGVDTNLHGLTTVEAYDPLANTWATKTPMPPPGLYFSEVQAVNGKIYVIAGDDSGVTPNGVATVQEFDPAGNNGAGSWSSKTSIPNKQHGATSGVLNNVIYIVGGTDPTTSVETTISTVQTYDPSKEPSNSAWSIAPDMLTPRVNLGAAVVANNTLYAIGGFQAGAATVGQQFIYQITATNHPTSYSASVLPSGLNFDTSLGIIFGTPTSASDNTVQFTATNGSGTGSAYLRLTIHAALPSGPKIISSTSATGRTGQPFHFQLVTSGGSSATHFTVGGLPAGLSIDPVTGLISGTSSSDGNFGLAVTAIDGSAKTHATLQLTFVSDPIVPIITSSASAYLAPGQFFSRTITADANASFSYIGTDGIRHQGVSTQGLPPGLSFDGVATISGTYTGGSSASKTSRTVKHQSSIALDPVIFPHTITIRPPRLSVAQLLSDNPSNPALAGTRGLDFFQATTFASWEQNYFTQAQLNDPTISCDSCDPDSDGLSNLLEYGLNSDPTIPSGTPPYSTLDPTYLSLTYTKALAATDLTYTIEESTNLIQWSPVTPVNQILTDDGFTQTIKAQVPKSDAGSGGKLYLRLRVSH
jgi:N-acetylneuraminic acid mutarotase